VLDLEGTIDGFIKLLGEEEGMKKVHRLAALHNRTYPRIGALKSAIASGEMDIAWHLGGHRADALKAKGVPADFVFEGPTFSVTHSISVAKEAPHHYTEDLKLRGALDFAQGDLVPIENPLVAGATA
jgi:ABC-type Fe3+ transport system substrate-binding protein